jgi:hypothetical protein
MKLLNPNTRIQTPVNCTASSKLQSKLAISAGNMGASASGPKPWVNVTIAAAVMHAPFQVLLQLSGSFGLSDG